VLKSSLQANAESQKAHGKARRHTMGMKRSNKPYVEYTRGTEAEYEGPQEKVHVPATPPPPSSPSDAPLAMCKLFTINNLYFLGKIRAKFVNIKLNMKIVHHEHIQCSVPQNED
jgi:hypothetical protein